MVTLSVREENKKIKIMHKLPEFQADFQQC